MAPEERLAGKTLLVGVGAQKAGTTWLHAQLSRRDDVYLPSGKELHYFDVLHRPDLCLHFGARLLERFGQDADRVARPDEAVPARRIADPAFYLDFFARRAAPGTRLVGEITPSYAALGEDGFRAIRGLAAEVRIVFLLRDPVERHLSNIRAGLWERDRRIPQDAEYLAWLDDPLVAARSRYDHTLAALDAVFDPGQLLVAFYEGIGSPALAERLGAFLGLPGLVLNPAARVNVTPSAASVGDGVRQALRARFAPVYDFCRERFGPELPAVWAP